jgi:DNA polymerase/3'-5' exonuclease PolX
MLFGMTEFDELKQEYESGKLDHIKRDLEGFIKKHDIEIKRFVQKLNSKMHHKISIDQGLRWYLIFSQTINTTSESKDQLEEIKREIWYRCEEGVKKPVDEIAKDWIAKHAAGWRDHRILQTIYAYTQESEKYLALLK